MKHSYIITFLLLSFVITVFGQNKIGSVRITIKKKLTNEAFTDSVFVSLNNIDTTSYRLMPNPDGEIIIKSLEPGKYNFNVSANGYYTTTIKNVIIGEGKTSHLDFGMTIKEGVNSKTNKRRKKKAL